MYFNRKYLKWHVLGCAAFLTLPLLLFPYPPEYGFSLSALPTIRDILGNILMLVFFYCNYYLLIPTLYYRRKYIAYGLCIIAGFLLIVYMPSLLTGRFTVQPPHGAPPPEPGLPPPPGTTGFLEEVRHSIFLFASVILFSILLAVRERLLLAEKASHEAELSYLKAQINPHFLFNSLNNIYSLALVKDDAAPDAIIRLSEMMRYITHSGKDDFVPLENEVNYIGHYVALQQIRFQHTVAINYLVKEIPAGKRIAPLILLCFIENAFKHGVNPDSAPVIDIRLEGDENGISLYVFNKKTGTVRHEYERGIGLDNTRERLDLLYPGRHRLAIDDARDTFTVNLSMDLA